MASKTNGTTTSTSADLSVSNSLSSHSSYSQVIASIGNTDTAMLDFKNLGSKTKIYIVPLSKLKGYKGGSASATRSTEAAAKVRTLDAKIAANASLAAKLTAEGYAPDKVVAESTDAKGNIILFVNDRA